ncbi:hypothetical protein ACHAWC_009974 [Mediolabrus comicus]
MTENMSDNSPTMKKRKANDGRATVPGNSSSHSGGGGGEITSRLGRDDQTTPTASTTCGSSENLTQKMDAMMQMMSRMEEKLTAVSSLESRCERLEAKCSVLERMLEMKTNSIKEHVDSKFDKQNKYNKMLVRNQGWKYSTPVHSAEYWETNGFDSDVAEYLSESSEELKQFSEKMRRGEFPSDCYDDRKGINLVWIGEPILDNNASVKMRLHWKEFAYALTQFTPAFGVLPDNCETYFTLENIQLDQFIPGLLKDALMHKPFQKLSFVNRGDVDDDERMSADAIMDIMNSNKHLRKLRIGNNRIELSHMEKICSAVRYGSIVELHLYNCFDNGLGDAMVTSLLSTGSLAKLERLCFTTNGITSSSITTLANFLATNPPLQMLGLVDNMLDDDDIGTLASALRTNTSLRSLDLSSNTIGDAGEEGLLLVVHDDSSLNSLADSNHSCCVVLSQFAVWNVCQMKGSDGYWHEAPASFNRARKIYRLLSQRNESMSTPNVHHFDDIDVNLLPSILEAVQRYAVAIDPFDRHRPGYCRVEPLSIVYEVMRKWDKVFPLYTDRGNSESIE